MALVLVGASHHDVPLETLSQLAPADGNLARHVVRKDSGVNGAVVLSTCNRFEVYLDLQRFHDGIDSATSAIAELLDGLRSRVGDDTASGVARSLNRVSNAILHTPSVRAQELARSGDLADHRKAMKTIFGIEIASDSGD